MNQQSSIIAPQHTSRSWSFWLVGLAIITGFCLSILSWMELCVEHCAANQDYRLFGFPFAIFGMTFFSALLILHLFSLSFHFLSQIVSWLIASALGAEMMFIAVQKYQIGHWCPVCLSIALTVGFAAFVLFTSYIMNYKSTLQLHNRGAIMHTIKHGLTSLSFLLLGFLMSFVGISNPNSVEATTAAIKEKLAFGLRDSPLEIYFVTDWFCPSCKKVEPLIEKLFPKLREESTFYFIDYPIHKKSMNFSPYNLAFLINSKDQYLKARNLLINLTDTNDSPKDDDIEKAARKEKISFSEVSYLDVKSGMDFFDSIVDKYKLKYTPTLIFNNTRTHKTVTLEGRDDITEQKIFEAIEKVNKKT